jgi:hypothetical protein
MRTHTEAAAQRVEVFQRAETKIFREVLTRNFAVREITSLMPCTLRAKTTFDRDGLPSGVRWELCATFICRVAEAWQDESRAWIVILEVRHSDRVARVTMPAAAVANNRSFFRRLHRFGGLGCALPGRQAATVRSIKATAPGVFGR